MATAPIPGLRNLDDICRRRQETFLIDGNMHHSLSPWGDPQSYLASGKKESKTLAKNTLTERPHNEGVFQPGGVLMLMSSLQLSLATIIDVLVGDEARREPGSSRGIH